MKKERDESFEDKVDESNKERLDFLLQQTDIFLHFVEKNDGEEKKGESTSEKKIKGTPDCIKIK